MINRKQCSIIAIALTVTTMLSCAELGKVHNQNVTGVTNVTFQSLIDFSSNYKEREISIVGYVVGTKGQYSITSSFDDNCYRGTLPMLLIDQRQKIQSEFDSLHRQLVKVRGQFQARTYPLKEESGILDSPGNEIYVGPLKNAKVTEIFQMTCEYK